MKIKVEKDTLIKDTTSNVVMETDISKLQRHRAICAAIHEKENKLDTLIDRINKLELIIERMTNGSHNI